MKHWMMILLTLSFVGVGCGGGLSEEDAGMAFSTTQQALDSTRTQAYSQASSQGGAAVDVACQGGGTVVWNNWDFGTGSLTSWSSEATFQSCNWRDVTMKGTINYEYSVQSEGNNASIRYVMKGTVNYSGSISGSCTYDIRMTISNGGFSYRGSYCGYQAASFNSTF